MKVALFIANQLFSFLFFDLFDFFSKSFSNFFAPAFQKEFGRALSNFNKFRIIVVAHIDVQLCTNTLPRCLANGLKFSS